MKEISKQKEEKILKLLEKHGCRYAEAAKESGISAHLIKCVDVKHNRKFGYTDEGLGRKELQKYLVGCLTIGIGEAWDNKDPKIKKARDDYDAGLSIVCTGRDGMNLLLYSIPRKKPIKNFEPYFEILEEEEEETNVQPIRH